VTPTAIVRFVIDTFEGKLYTDHPLDTGGATKFGFTLRTIQYYRRLVSGNPNLVVTKADVKNLTIDEAVSCGVRVFMKEPRISDITNWKVQLVTYDYGFHSGQVTAISDLQAAMGMDNRDGVIGPITLGTYNLFDDKLLLAFRLMTYREEFMQRLIAKKPSQRIWTLGWWNRTTKLQRIICS
jgi:lysozyme family protein